MRSGTGRSSRPVEPRFGPPIPRVTHRSQYGFGGKVNEKTGEMSYEFASDLRDALPNAPFIGFTGTPIGKMDANTWKRQRRGLIPAWGNAPDRKLDKG